jgi:hypothetical protein
MPKWQRVLLVGLFFWLLYEIYSPEAFPKADIFGPVVMEENDGWAAILGWIFLLWIVNKYIV